MFLMRADPLQGQVVGGWALEVETFSGPVNWHRAVRRMQFGAQKVDTVIQSPESSLLVFCRVRCARTPVRPAAITRTASGAATATTALYATTSTGSATAYPDTRAPR